MTIVSRFPRVSSNKIDETTRSSFHLPSRKNDPQNDDDEPSSVLLRNQDPIGIKKVAHLEENLRADPDQITTQLISPATHLTALLDVLGRE